jgi:class 3 adenylate cyclase
MSDMTAKESFERMRVRYPIRSLEDFLVGTPLHADAQLDDGWGARYPVKGRELEATILFADITGFSARTLELTPMETLVFVNNFFAWITAEALRSSKGVVDKYIGDEIMVVFAKEFGSADPFREAIEAARFMAENDAHSYIPHIGLASGRVAIGYVGTPLKYSATVLGAPVAMAARCAGVIPRVAEENYYSTSISFPATDWGERDFDEVFPPVKLRTNQAERDTGAPEFIEQPHGWELLEPQAAELKNLPDTAIRSVINKGVHIPSTSAEDRARESMKVMREAGRYHPRWQDEE